MSAPTVRLTGPADLLAVVPHMLGYQPEGSLIAVALHQTPDGSRRLGMVERIDMPDEGEAFAAAEALTPPMLREAPGAVVLIGYEKITGEASIPLGIFADMLTANGLRVMDSIAVGAGRWRSLHCQNPECCPPDGSPMPGPDAAPSLHFVAAGSAPLASREAVTARVVASARAEAVGRECRRQSATDGVITTPRGVAAWARILGISEPANVADLSDDTLALAALALHADDEPVLRDALLAWLQPGTLPLDVVDKATIALLREHLPFPWHDGAANTLQAEDNMAAQRRTIDRLCHLCAALPDSHAAPALTVLASFAWWLGDGAIASTALDRALTSDPGYRLALLLQRMISLCIRPCT